MTFEKLKQEKADVLGDKNFVISDFDNISKSDDFNMPGVYILVEKESKEVVYIGSAYARNLKERLVQYRYNGSGNTLKKDLEYIGKAGQDEFKNYLSTLEIYAFEERSSEYQLLDTAGLIVANKAGTKNNKNKKK